MADEEFRDDDIDLRTTTGLAAKVNSQGKPLTGYEDPQGVYPKKEYENIATTNVAARGFTINELLTHGGDVDLSLEFAERLASQYPLNQVRETVSGHIIEVDDTPGAERMLYRHRTGAGIELRSDGSIVISAVKNTVRITGGDEKVIVEGDGEITYHGNLKLNVTGDFDIKVGGDFNVITGGNKVEDIHGSYKQIVNRNHDTTVRKNRNAITTGTSTTTNLGNYNLMVKGNQSNYVEGSANLFVSDTLTMTAKNEVTMSSVNTNIAASSLTVIGDSGTIGGDNIINYFYNAYGVSALFEAGVQAPCFIGDLTGKADDANKADFATTAGQAPLGSAGSPGSNTHVDRDTRETVEPTTAIMEDYLDKSSKGYRRVQVDINDILRRKVDKTTDYGGVSSRPLSTPEVRSKLRDPKNYNNRTFIGSQISEGKLSPTYVRKTPYAIGRIIKNQPMPIRGTRPIGNRSKGLVKRVQTR